MVEDIREKVSSEMGGSFQKMMRIKKELKVDLLQITGF
ncbi:hypothetical protein ECP03048162_4959 [Escherichia coli P0304816.2]|nr:hypothetical protein ECP03048162_4959 [Escherichia coli P0304816.2]